MKNARNGSSFVLSGALAVALGLSASAATVSPGMEVVVPSGNGGVERALKLAAETLSDAFREGAGEGLRVVTAERHDPAAKAVFLGRAAAEAAGFDLAGFEAMENVVAEKDGNVYLFGNDRPGRKDAREWYNCVLPSARAVARFMEGSMNARFLMPGAVGLDVPAFASVELAPGAYDREKPYLTTGNGRFHGQMYDLANNIFGNGSLHTYGGHTYPRACPVEKYFDEHPEYFALRAGKRTGQKGNPALCVSNPAVEDLLVAEILRRFDDGADIVELGQNDGLDFCECEACAAYGHGLGYGEQFWIIHRRVAERLYKLRPDKKVQIIAYGPTAQLPQTFKDFPPNVMVETMKYDEKTFADWQAFGVPNGYTVYTYIWGRYPTPGLTAKRTIAYVADMARRFIRNNVKGIYRCGFGELFGTEGPAYYVFNRLLADPTRNEQQLFAEYCTRAYGPASKPMIDFFRTLDACLDCVHRSGGSRDLAITKPLPLLTTIYSPVSLAALEASLAAAEGTPGLTAKQKKRLELTRFEFNYARQLAKIGHLYEAYTLVPAQGTFDPLADEILARNAFLDSLYDEKGKIRPFPGWPEVWVLGDAPKPMLKTNGRLSATLGSPYLWDVELLRANGVLPGKVTKQLDIVRATERPTFASFASGTGAWTAAAWNELGGICLEPVNDKTRFKVLWDETNLYFGLETTLKDEVVVRPCGMDGKPWLQDSLELMIDPTATAARWYHLMFNAVPDSFCDMACGLIDDPLDPKYGQSDASWNGKWTYECDRAAGIWRAFVTVPFATLGTTAPAVGETWRMNVARESGENGRGGLSLWSPNFESRAIPAPAAYGKAVFR